MKRYLSFLLICLILCACGNGRSDTYVVERYVDNGVPTVSGELFAMDTYMTVTCRGEKCEEALKASLDEIRRLDALLSVGNPKSEISRLNRNKSAVLSDDTAAILSEALSVYGMTDGAFDCTVYPVMELWGFPSGNFSVPNPDEITRTLETVGSEKLQYEPATKTVALNTAAGIDLGGIAKGYTSDRLMEIFKEYRLKSGSVSLGGNVQFYGEKSNGELWRCGIQNPENPDSDEYLGIVSVRDMAVITSGAYQRHFTDKKTGKVYHHIINPKSGVPAESGLTSVTVISKSGIRADALSTAVFILGLEKAKTLWRENRDNFDLILQTEDKTLYVTAPIADSFSTEYAKVVIE